MPNAPVLANTVQVPSTTNTVTGFSASFLGLNNKVVAQITNFTEFNLERSFFTAPDAFTLVIEDNDAEVLSSQIATGMAVLLTINGELQLNVGTGVFSLPNPISIVGYIFDYDYQIDRQGHGQRLTISGQDLLGWMSKTHCLPNLGNSAINSMFTFKPDTTFLSAITTIFGAFQTNVGYSALSSIVVSAEDTHNTLMKLSSGGLQGLQQSKAKKGRALSTSITKSLEHLLSPKEDESYFQYAERIAKHIGLNIKMELNAHGGNVTVAAPNYNEDGSQYQFSIIHSKTQPNNNNVLTGGMKLDLEGQPSVIVVEKATSGNNFFYQATRKCFVVNEISGYPQLEQGYLQPLAATATPMGYPVWPITNVTETFGQLKKDYNYVQIQPNQDLYDLLNNSGVRNVQTTISAPLYYRDQNCHSDLELQFSAAKKMAEFQDKYLTLNYQVVGFTQNGYIWQTNAMCYVNDESLGIDGVFWIKKVNFTQSRAGGTHTHIELSLPYTHLGLECIEQKVSNTVVHPEPAPAKDYIHNAYVNGKLVVGINPDGSYVLEP